jgi:hypothetical protein
MKFRNESGSEIIIPKGYKEVKETIIPPGIVKFKQQGNFSDGNPDNNYMNMGYDAWVKMHLDSKYETIVYTIEHEGVQWSIGDKYHHGYGSTHEIKSFQWHTGEDCWKIITVDGMNTYLQKDSRMIKVKPVPYYPKELVDEVIEQSKRVLEYHSQRDMHFLAFNVTLDKLKSYQP